MRSKCLVVAVVSLLGWLVSPVPAETVNEVWRSPFGVGRAVAVNQTDGSCWAATGQSVMHVAADGSVLSQTDGLAGSLAVNPTDGSCWVVDSGAVVHLGADGAEVWRGAFPGGASSVSVDPTDGSCWVGSDQVVHLSASGEQMWQGGPEWVGHVVVNTGDRSVWATFAKPPGGIVHLAADGHELWRGTLLGELAVNPADGSVWLLNTDGVYHLDENGAPVGPGGPIFTPSNTPLDIAVAADGSCWVSSYSEVPWDYTVDAGGHLTRLAGDGTVLASWYETAKPYAIAVGSDGSLWAADAWASALVHLTAAGAVLWQGWGLNGPQSISVNTADRSFWIADSRNDQVVHLAADGEEIWRGDSFWRPFSVSVNPGDGCCWVADSMNDQVVLLHADGSIATVQSGFYGPWAVSVNTSDGSCWVVDAGNDQVVHLASNGSELWRGDFVNPDRLSASPFDGSCWIGDYGLVHIDANGAELSQDSGLSVYSIAADASDGSCWVASGESGVVHVAPNGIRAWQGGPYAEAVAVNSVDGSCWVLGGSKVTHLSKRGEELWYGGSFAWAGGYEGGALAVDPSDGSCLVVDGGSGQAVRLAVHIRFSDVPYYHWAFHQVDACAAAGVVQGYSDGTYDPGAAVTRGAMAVYIARAMALPTGDAAVPAGPPTATFGDVPNTGYGTTGSDPYWAYKYVEYCVANDVVRGYSATVYGPEDTVTRDQMAVFVARAKGWIGINDNMATAPQLFTDVLAGHWAGTAIQACVSHDVVQGYEDGSYAPGAAVSRDMMAVYIQRAFELPL